MDESCGDIIRKMRKGQKVYMGSMAFKVNEVFRLQNVQSLRKKLIFKAPPH